MATNLELQVQKELEELRTAPHIEPAANTVGRCHFCGAVTRNLRFVERVGDGRESPIVERYRGEDCCGY